jgi:hypothetical protein
MSFGFPLGLLGFLAVGPVVAAYFLRRKLPVRTVSALFLWRTPQPQAEAGPRFRRFSRELSLALETLAILAGAFFLADARCGTPTNARHTLVVVDGSLSMQASTGLQRTVADDVRRAVAALVQSEDSAVLTVIESGVRPRLLAGPQLDATRALAALESWTPAAPAHDVLPAFALAKELATHPKQRVFFFTDGPVGETALPPEVQGTSVGQRSSNVGFLSAQRADERGAATVTLRVGNFADEKRSVQVRFTAGPLAEQRTVDIGAGNSAIVQLTMGTTEVIEVSLADDALAMDGHLSLLPERTKHLRAALLSGLDEATRLAVTKALAASPHVSFEGEPTLTIGPGPSKAQIRIGTSGALRSFVGPFFAAKNHPLLDDVQLGGVVWTAGANPEGQPLLSAGDAVLLSEEDDGTIHLNLEVTRSNVQRSVGWPVFWGNVVRRAQASQEGFSRHLIHVGEEIPTVVSGSARWVIRHTSGATRPVFGSGALLLPPLEPGRWTLLRDDHPVDALEVLALDASESDLRTRGPWSADAAKTEALASFATERPRWWGWIALVVALVLADFWVTARRGA